MATRAWDSYYLAAASSCCTFILHFILLWLFLWGGHRAPFPAGFQRGCLWAARPWLLSLPQEQWGPGPPVCLVLLHARGSLAHERSLLVHMTSVLNKVTAGKFLNVCLGRCTAQKCVLITTAGNVQLDTWWALCPLMYSPPLVSNAQHSAIPPLSHLLQPLLHFLSCPAHPVEGMQQPDLTWGDSAVGQTLQLLPRLAHTCPYLLAQPRFTHSPAAPKWLGIGSTFCSRCPSSPSDPNTLLTLGHTRWCKGHACRCETAFLQPHPEHQLRKALSPLLPTQSWFQGRGTPGLHKCSAPAACPGSQLLPGQPCSPCWLWEAAAERWSAWPDVKGISLVLGHLMTGGREYWNELLPSFWCKMSADTLL